MTTQPVFVGDLSSRPGTAGPDRTAGPAANLEPGVGPGADQDLAARLAKVRELTEALAAPLSAEDQTAQSMPDASPTKWHRAHTTWFFETFVLNDFADDYTVFHPAFEYLFNSYYESVGARYPRPQRGLVTRPGIDEIASYRAHVDDAMQSLLAATVPPEAEALVELGCQHEQQHQELLLMDIKNLLFSNPLHPAYSSRRREPEQATTGPSSLDWTTNPGGTVEIGYGGSGFCFDNETPRHRCLLEPFALAARPVSSGEWLAFMADGGYERPELWLSDGWASAQANNWQSPLYWFESDGTWCEFTLGGDREVDLLAPVCHVSYYEADAYARWADARLPTEQEWEAAAASGAQPPSPVGCLDLEILHPRFEPEASLMGHVWQWTSSAYLPYRGFRPAAGAVGEYNGKFMVNQHVLRGGCAVTPPGHARASYRNFFPPAARWAFSGLRLAKDV